MPFIEGTLLSDIRDLLLPASLSSLGIKRSPRKNGYEIFLDTNSIKKKRLIRVEIFVQFNNMLCKLYGGHIHFTVNENNLHKSKQIQNSSISQLISERKIFFLSFFNTKVTILT